MLIVKHILALTQFIVPKVQRLLFAVSSIVQGPEKLTAIVWRGSQERHDARELTLEMPKAGLTS